ncbi:Ig-like domain-containing protein, partial [Brevibacillus reuszeri]|uniref:Ig-like domain-containing protein n=1 Tax=Brevibacillus reuszeri TaxID=54915 RepID=UPI001F35E96C
NTDMQTNIGFNCNGVTNVFALEPITNNPPTLTLTSPADNQTLTEGSTYKLEGTVSDADAGNALSVKYSIAGGPTQTISLGTSDGSTAKSFSKTLKYSQGRFWDGATDVSGLLPAEASSIQVWANDGIDDSAKVTRNFTVVQEDGKIIIPVNVVSSAFLVSRMAPPVLLSNGWIVGAVRNSTDNLCYYYVSKDNGKTFTLLTKNDVSVYGGFSICSVGVRVYTVSCYSGNIVLRLSSFDATKVGATHTTSTTLDNPSGKGEWSGVSSAITPDGTKLWWAASTKNATYPNSFNIRAGSIPINADGTLGVPSAAMQVTTLDSSITNNTNPTIDFKPDGHPIILYQQRQGGTSTYLIVASRFTGTNWQTTTVFSSLNYPQNEPKLIRTPNGKLHAVWHGTDSNDVTNDFIRYSNTTDGASWSTPKKLWLGKNASITSDKNGRLFIAHEMGTILYERSSADEFVTSQINLQITGGSSPASLYDPTFQTDFTIPPTIFQTTDTVKYYGSLILNKKPVITLTTPDNRTLTENSTYDVAGNAVDEDVGNVVTVYYKINNGPPQAAASDVSDGSTPILFSKQLIYKNKRVYLGTTDITGADLAENVDHILTVWADDNKPGKSTELTRKFRVVWNRPPVIDGQNGDIGIHETPPEVTYAAYDPEGNAFSITEKINGVVTRSFAGVANRQETFQINHDTWLKLEPGVLHSLTIEAVDDQGAKSTRVYTFTRFEDQLSFEIEVPWTTDVAAKRVLLTMDMSLPPGALFVAEATNNAFDAAPRWEDISFNARYGRGYIFQNEQKTATQWGISIRVHIEKGTATEPIIVKGFGGAFD